MIVLFLFTMRPLIVVVFFFCCCCFCFVCSTALFDLALFDLAVFDLAVFDLAVFDYQGNMSQDKQSLAAMKAEIQAKKEESQQIVKVIDNRIVYIKQLLGGIDILEFKVGMELYDTKILVEEAKRVDYSWRGVCEKIGRPRSTLEGYAKKAQLISKNTGKKPSELVNYQNSQLKLMYEAILSKQKQEEERLKHFQSEYMQKQLAKEIAREQDKELEKQAKQAIRRAEKETATEKLGDTMRVSKYVASKTSDAMKKLTDKLIDTTLEATNIGKNVKDISTPGTDTAKSMLNVLFMIYFIAVFCFLFLF